MIQDPKAEVHQINVVETYPTVEGEGVLVGTPIMIIRLWGCHLTCSYCDSRYAWDPALAKGGEDIESFPSGESVVQRLKEIETKRGLKKHQWVSLTGGEPLHRPPTQLVDLCAALSNDDRRIMVQTTGTVHRPQLFGFVNFWSISPPLHSSGNSVLGRPPLMRNIERLLAESRNVALRDDATMKGQLKFVVATEDDLEEAIQLYEDWDQYHAYKVPVVFQPVQWPDEGLSAVMSRFERLIYDPVIRAMPNVRVIPQIQKAMFLNERNLTIGGVTQ